MAMHMWLPQKRGDWKYYANHSGSGNRQIDLPKIDAEYEKATALRSYLDELHQGSAADPERAEDRPRSDFERAWFHGSESDLSDANRLNILCFI